MYIEVAANGDLQESVGLLWVLCKHSSDQIYIGSLRKVRGSNFFHELLLFPEVVTNLSCSLGWNVIWIRRISVSQSLMNSQSKRTLISRTEDLVFCPINYSLLNHFISKALQFPNPLSSFLAILPSGTTICRSGIKDFWLAWDIQSHFSPCRY